MSDQSREAPIETEIRALIADGKFAEACDKACLAYRREIVAYCIKRLRSYVSNPETDGEDLAQKILDEFCRKLPAAYKPSHASVRTYLYAIATHRVLDATRKVGTGIRNRNTARRELKRSAGAKTDLQNPESIFLKKEEKKLLNRAVEMLEITQRRTINLWRQGFPTAEIARIIDKTDGAIRVELSRIRANLQKTIDLDIIKLYAPNHGQLYMNDSFITGILRESFIQIISFGYGLICPFCNASRTFAPNKRIAGCSKGCYEQIMTARPKFLEEIWPKY